MSVIRAVCRLPLAATMFVAVGCGSRSERSDAAGASAAMAQVARAPAATLDGRWAITAVNGSAPRAVSVEAEADRPHLVFSASHYGGSTGCNSFGGTGLLLGDRWFGEGPIQTEQGCGDLTQQEEAIIGVAAGGPTVRFQGRDAATLRTATGSLALRREGGVEPDAGRRETGAEPDAGRREAGSEPDAGRRKTGAEPDAGRRDEIALAGTAWDVRAIDGRLPGAVTRRELPLLTFEADRWTLTGLCNSRSGGSLSGGWRQAGAEVAMQPPSMPPADCNAEERTAAAAFRAMVATPVRYVTGPNRELVMAGGGHWLAGQFDRSLGRDDIELLRGEWRVDSIDGRAPSASGRPASLAFGKASYAVWDGCNHTEGVMLTFARQVFTLGSGVSTLALCPPDPMRSRIAGFLVSHPRIAKAGGGTMALVSPAGTLRMTRLSARGFGSGEQLGLRAPMTIPLLAPKAGLVLAGAGRFAVELACGRFEGSWRGGQPARFSPDPIARTAPGCAGDGDASRLQRFFTGNVLAVIGPNRDIVLLVNEGRSLAGRLPR